MSSNSIIIEKIKVLNRLNEEIKGNIQNLYVFKDIRKEINVILITNEDKVYCCGNNDTGVLGFGHNNNVEEFTINEELSNNKIRIIDFKSNERHTIALDYNGNLYCWGSNKYLGNGRENFEISKPELNKYFKNVNIIKVCCGFSHTLVLTSDNEVYGWGSNYFGQIGNSSAVIGDYVFKPFKLNTFNGEKVIEISCGSYHSIVLLKSGCVYSWGSNVCGQLGLNIENKIQKIPKKILIEVEIQKICCGYDHSLLLSREGDIYVFGNNEYKQLGVEIGLKKKQLTPIKLNRSEKFIDIASHYNYSISAALSENGFYYVWGDFGEEGIISEPKETQFKSFNELFVHYLGITFEISSYDGQYIHEFEEIKLLGNGSFGKVFKVVTKSHSIEQKFYAIKIINLKDGFTREEKEKSLREIQILKKLKKDFVVHHITSWIEYKNKLHIQMELCYKDLDDILEQIKNEFNRKNFEIINTIEYFIYNEIFKELVECLNYLHTRNPPIIHRDLKPQNILIPSKIDGRFVKLADFGSSVIHEKEDQSHTEDARNRKYMAPEVFNGRDYNTKADIHSLGLIASKLFDIYIKASTNTPIENPLLKERFELISQYIVKMMLEKNKRPDCEQLLKNKSLWYLDLDAIESDLTQQKFNELSISELSMEKSFYKFFIKTKLMNKC